MPTFHRLNYNEYCTLLLLSVSVILFFVQCQPDKSTPDVSDIQVDITIRRFEKELFALDTSSSDIPFKVQVANLAQRYPQFMEVFPKLIEEAYALDTSQAHHIEQFIKYKGAQVVYDTAQAKFADLADIESDLEEAFQFYKYYFPTRPIPEVVSYVSFFSTGTFTYGDSLLGIGLDFFLESLSLISMMFFQLTSKEVWTGGTWLLVP
ncbi:MAG: hypothetical protein HC892_04345 [Saprospiraceae bacterium]|nr:hypothetical protein [Saprospiraceae bacterium]